MLSLPEMAQARKERIAVDVAWQRLTKQPYSKIIYAEESWFTDPGTFMTPDPTALALIICEQVIVDYNSRNPSPISIFSGLAVERFPSDPQRFSVFAALTDADRTGRLELRCIRLDTGDQIYAQQYPIDFPDRATVVNVNIRVRNIRFPIAGTFDFLLLVDQHLIAQRRLRVYASPP
jgi:uncharacterized protein DUF6941